MKQFIFQPKWQTSGEATAYLQTTNESAEMKVPPTPAVVICPGGGYRFTSDREAEPMAKVYLAAGFHVFILRYSVLEHAKDFQPLKELAGTIAYIRDHASQWNLDSEKIAVEGFSAGGHLACSLGTLYNDPHFLRAWGHDAYIRPNALVLGYPVITAGAFAHAESIETVSGASQGEGNYAYFGLENHVDRQTPPTFLWHTAEDTGVPVENSLIFASVLSAHHVPFELHILPQGGHGMSTCTAEVGTKDAYNARRTEWSVKWLEKVFHFEG